ncbi:hypothetical protein BDZ94DRAFT_1033684 [Collybia nuda]|uniref:Uncharacterized protein n=1 Tax=Collybia nuda TaxID=64659 RepID=A0A9P5YET5_9AGAR|nr:hypothetical protein BDZ94DRAFT_1033684 [Collybia nuda]
MRQFYSLFLGCAALFGIARSFSFTVGVQPSQCDPLSISWTGGQLPFRLIIVMPSLVNINVTIPDSNFKDNRGSFELPALGVSRGTSLFFAMSDATGAMSGGTSDLMIVGESLTGQICNTTTPANDFFFTTPNTLTQCSAFAFTSYQGAIKPLTIFAFIPGGTDSFIVPFSPPDTDSFVWKANITAQTHVSFSVIDSQGRFGGSNSLHLVAPSNDYTCLLTTGGNSTSELPNTPSPTSSSNPSQTSNPGHKSSNLPVGAIVAFAIGGIVVVVILAALLWWLRKRRSKSNVHRDTVDLADDFPSNPEIPQPMLSQQFAPVPYPSIYMSQASSSVSSFRPEQLRPPLLPPLLAQSQNNGSTSSLAAASSSKPGSQSKFIVHRDIDEVEEPIELPPQYDGHRTPIPGLVQASPLQHGGQPKAD